MEDLDAIKVFSGKKPNKGMQSTHAIRDIKRGTRIIKEQAILRFGDRAGPLETYSTFLEMNPDDRTAYLGLSCRESEQKANHLSIYAGIDRGVLTLANEKSTAKRPGEEAAKVLAIYQDNQIPLQPREIGDQKKTIAEVGLKIARINHDCEPNVAIAYNSNLHANKEAEKKGIGMYTVQAIKDIKEKDEIVCSYVYTPMPRADRQANLEKKGVECKCSACDFQEIDLAQQQEDVNTKMRPKLGPRRSSTGTLNKILYKQNTPQSSENRRVAWQKRNVALNSTKDDSELYGLIPVVDTLIEFLGPESTRQVHQQMENHDKSWPALRVTHEMHEERVRLYVLF